MAGGRGRLEAVDRRRQRQLGRQRRDHLRQVGRQHRSQDLKGKTIAAEEGVVDHFLLLQGLASVGLTQDDVDFRGVLTDAAAGAFAGGQFDCVGVFAPFTLQALERPGSHVVFSSQDFPGTIPDHIVVAQRAREGARQPTSRSSSTPGTRRSTTSRPTRRRASTSWRPRPTCRRPTTRSSPRGTKLFTVDEALAAFQDGDTSTSLQYTARQINPFLVESGLTQKKASLKGLFVPKFTQAYADRFRLRSVATRTSLATEVAADPDPAESRPTAEARTRARARWRGGRPGKGRGRRQGALLRLRAEIPLSARVVLAFAGVAGLLALWWFAATFWSTNAVLVPSPSAAWNAGVDYWNSGDLWHRLRGERDARPQGLLDQHGHRHRARPRDRQLPIGRGVLGVADRVPALHPGHRAHAAVPALARHRRAAEGRARSSRAPCSSTS